VDPLREVEREVRERELRLFAESERRAFQDRERRAFQESARAFQDREREVQKPERRTVVITGRGAERTPVARPGATRSRPPVPRYERAGFRPDRVAMWAVLLGLVLVLIAATSSHAAVLAHALAR
jgi:hypothetical protein